jgi:glucose-1-phosphate adenylyltransferase
MDYRDFLARHYDSGADVTISVVPANRKDAEGFGLLKVDDTGRIIEFKEKPKGEQLETMRVDTSHFGLSAAEAEERPFLASMGIYVFNYAYLERILAEDPSRVDFGRELIPGAIKSGNVQAFVFNGYWEDIGTISAFYNANLDLTSRLPKFNFFDTDAPIYSRARYLPPSKIHDCEIRDSIISDGCIVQGARLSRAIIGLRSRIGQGTHMDSSIMMGCDFYQSLEDMRIDTEAGIPRIGVGENSVIRRAIIDKNARIGSGVRLLNEAGKESFDAPDGSYYIRDRIIIVPKNAVIADDTIV